MFYPKLEKVYRGRLNHEDLIEQVLKIAKFVKPTSKVLVIQEHPADNSVLECALATCADYIISGDKHILKLASFEKTKVVSANDFLKLI